MSTRVETVQKSTDDIKKKEEVKAEEQMNRPLDLDVNFMFPNMGGAQANQGPAAIMPAAGSMPPNMGGGFNPAMQMPGNNMGANNMGGMGGMPNMGGGGMGFN